MPQWKNAANPVLSEIRRAETMLRNAIEKAKRAGMAVRIEWRDEKPVVEVDDSGAQATRARVRR